MVPVRALGAAAPLLGIAEGVLEAYRERLGERVMTYSPGTKQREVPGARLRLAYATAETARGNPRKLHAATLAFDDAVARLDSVRDGAPQPDLTERVRIRWTVAWVVGVCGASSPNSSRAAAPAHIAWTHRYELPIGSLV